MKDWNLGHPSESPSGTTDEPGFDGVNNRQSHDPMQTSEVSNDNIVGKAVTGVVESAFDAGYLLKVRIGDSDISLRGVVFKPGRYVPVSEEIDIAPQFQMIQRKQNLLQKDRKVRSYGSRSRGSRKKQEDRAINNSMASFLNGSQCSSRVIISKPAGGSTVVSGICSDKPMQQEAEEMNEPLSVEPLRSIICYGFNNQISTPMENREIGRMSELLEVLEENSSDHNP